MNSKTLFLLALILIAVALVSFRLYRAGTYGITNFYFRELWTLVHRVDRQPDESLLMRDGVRLATDVYLPKHTDPPYPTIFIQTPYDKRAYFGGLHAVRLFTPAGYAVVVQDVRGRYRSEGEFVIYDSAIADGWDSLDWIASQPWSNGNIGTFGCSALGEIQYILASSAHPNHKAMIVEAGGGAIGRARDRHGYFGLWEGGVFNLASGVGWFAESGFVTPIPERGTVTPELLNQVPIVEAVARSGAGRTAYEDYVSHPPGDSWWDAKPYLARAEGFSVPGLHVNSWFDLGAQDTLTLALGEGLDDAAPQSVIMSPATHCGSEELPEDALVGELRVLNGNQPYAEIFRSFFDSTLKQGKETALPRLRLFVLGSNRWVDFDSWPPSGSTYLEWYLSSAGGANSAAGDGRLMATMPTPGRDVFVYDPANPVPTRGGPHCCTGNPDDQPGSFDQAVSATRDDVLVFDSGVLQDDMHVVGPLSARLFVSTTGADTDFTVKLVDIHPEGRAMNVQDGVFRLRYRDGYAVPKEARVGEVFEIEVGMRATAYTFAAGHRVRLEVSSSNFPRLARNLNTGGDQHLETQFVTVTNTVLHGVDTPSALRLPVLPRLPDP